MEGRRVFGKAPEKIKPIDFVAYLLSFACAQRRKICYTQYIVASQFLLDLGIREDVLFVLENYKKIKLLAITENYLLIIEDEPYNDKTEKRIINFVKFIKNNTLYKNKQVIVGLLETDEDFNTFSFSEINSDEQDYYSLSAQYFHNLLESYKSDDFTFNYFYQQMRDIVLDISYTN